MDLSAIFQKDPNLNTFHGALSSGLDTFGKTMQAAYLPQQLQQELLKMKLGNQLDQVKANYADPMAKQELLKSQLYNQFYAPSMQASISSANAGSRLTNQQADWFGRNSQSEIDSRRSSTALNDLKAKYPGLGDPGAVGMVAYANYLKGQPGALDAVKPGASIEKPNTYGFDLNNPIEFLNNTAMTDLNYKNALTKSMQTNITARPFEKLPAAEKSFAIAQGRAFGLTGEETSKQLQEGKTLSEIAKEQGFDPKDKSSWPVPQGAPTNAIQTRLQRANMTLGALQAVEPEIAKASSIYGGKFHDISPSLLKDMVKGENEDKQADILAAYAIAPETNALRINAMGGNVGISAIRDMGESSFSRLNTLGISPNSQVYIKAQKKLNDWIKKMNRAENRALYQQQQQSYEEEDKSSDQGLTNQNLTQMSDADLQRIAGGP